MDTSQYLSTNSKAGLWINDIHKNMVALGFKVEKTLFSGRSKFQQVDVVQTAGHGAMLLNDGIVQLSERDEFIYHEMIAHVPFFVHPAPQRVLVIGGGDGGTVREILKHRSITRVVMVEIDEMVVQASRRYLPSVSCALDDPRLELRIEDGIKFVNHTDERFDVVIVDSTDPIGVAQPLFNQEFYQQVAAVLAADGIMITQAESPFYDHDIQHTMFMNQRPFFKKLHIYLFCSLTYPGGCWGFGYASKGLCPLKDFDPGRVEKAGIATRYYNAGIHRAAFMLPTFVQENLARVIDPFSW
ncbi:MAG: polyamine aminopropyltransferase [Pseudomonadota bacterium]|uniref:Polyamine aminopropyltransferase n=1 Tax=Candidatus Desulfatibia profunda TaxID=2841695 RepID=A0A8J6NYD1_9BACT|nr:polyamine aminopropyltransferase [Candidatus Desulfatibia profunda]MBL7180648.1 polyamine aminopropyltransferase [Desulfobacterales bacterium]MBU0698597.1 polyamine aminopropyltransferase [Pseudomonadota bacterium]